MENKPKKIKLNKIEKLSLAIAVVGAIIISEYSEKTIVMYDVETGECLHVNDDPSGKYTCDNLPEEYVKEFGKSFTFGSDL